MSGDGTDLLDLSGYASVADINDLYIYQNGDHTVVTADGPQVLTLLNTVFTTLDTSNFIF